MLQVPQKKAKTQITLAPFITYHHAGITSVVTRESYELLLAHNLDINAYIDNNNVVDWHGWEEKCLPFLEKGGRIYTFMDRGRIEGSRRYARVITGSLGDWKKYTAGDESLGIKKIRTQRMEMHVPFSRGPEHLQKETFFTIIESDLEKDFGPHFKTMTVY